MASNEPPVIEGARGVMVKMGLATPIARAFTAAAVVGVGAYVLGTPLASFDEKGEMRPLAGLSKAPTATYAHFLLLPLVVGAATYVFT